MDLLLQSRDEKSLFIAFFLKTTMNSEAKNWFVGFTLSEAGKPIASVTMDSIFKKNPDE